MKKKAFTLAEIMVAIVIMSIVVAVVVPITKDKLQKVDYATYYLGYKTLQPIITEIMPKILEKIKQEECVLEIGNTCYSTKPKKAHPVTKSVCETMKSNGSGIEQCKHNNDYWAGAVQECSEKTINMPTRASLQEFRKFIMNGNSYNTDLLKNTIGIDISAGDVFNIWSNEEVNIWLMGENAYGYEFSENMSNWRSAYKYVSRNTPDYYYMCVKPMPDPADYTKDLLRGMAETFSTTQVDDSLDTTVADIQGAVATRRFNDVEPHVTLTNGVRIYVGAHYDDIPKLSDAEPDDRKGWLLYLDVNGKKGRSGLYEDVYPFYLLKSGKIVPDYEAGNVAGASSEENMSVQVLYDEFDDVNNIRLERRLTPVATGGADVNSFKSAACASGYIKSATYCGYNVDADNNLINPNNPNCSLSANVTMDCRIKVKAPIRILK